MLVRPPTAWSIYDGRSAQAGRHPRRRARRHCRTRHWSPSTPTGTIGITIAGYDAANAGIIQHYEIAGSTGHSLGKRAWPMFHQNPQLTGWLSQPASRPSQPPIVGMASTGDGQGYWNVASDGGLFAFGDAALPRVDGRPAAQPADRGDGRHAGTAAATGRWPPTAGCSRSVTPTSTARPVRCPLNRPVVGMAATPDGRGYWEVASDGGLFAFGDARFYGSTGSLPLNQPVVGMAATPDGRGYWLVASDGGLFAFGDAAFYGSMGGQPLNRPVVGMAANGGHGYWLVASDGGHLRLRRRPFYGSTGSLAWSQPVVGMAAPGPAVGLLDGGGRRRHVRLRHRLLRLDPPDLRCRNDGGD